MHGGPLSFECRMEKPTFGFGYSQFPRGFRVSLDPVGDEYVRYRLHRPTGDRTGRPPMGPARGQFPPTSPTLRMGD